MIFTDADNTLWDTNKVFADAQLLLVVDVENEIGLHLDCADRLEYLRDIDQDLASEHHSGLRYPPALLAVALALSLGGSRKDEAVRTALKKGVSALPQLPAIEIEQKFQKNLQRLARLRKGVKTGLARLFDAELPAALVTEGHRDRCVQLLEHHKLRRYVSRIIESKKNVELYRRLKRLDVTKNSESIMIGDQLDRDIIPANEAGFITIYYPSHFAPKWTVQELVMVPGYTVQNFNDAVTIILDLYAGRIRRNTASRMEIT